MSRRDLHATRAAPPGTRGLALGLLLALGGCGDSVGGDPETASESGGHGEPQAAPSDAVADAALVIAVPQVPGRFDPAGDLDPWAQRIVDDLLFEGLVRREGDTFPFVSPALADRCLASPEDGPKRVECHLRSDRVFHDGSPVTPDDVLYSLRYWTDARRSGLRARHGLAGLHEVELVDAPMESSEDADPGRWIRLTFESPEPLALEHIAAMKIVPKAAHRGHVESFGRAPIGSGPMKLVALEPDRVVLERAGDGSPGAAPGLVLRALPDGAEALSFLRRGQIHILAEVSPTHIPQELSKPAMAPRFEGWVLTPPRYDLLLYNLRHGSQSELPMRKALDAALPRQAIAKLHPMPPASLAAPVDVLAPRRLDIAALEAAGPGARWGMAGLPFDRNPTADETGQAGAAAMLDALHWPLDRGWRRRSTGALRPVLLWNGAPGLGAEVAAAIRRAYKNVGIQFPSATAGWAYIHGLMRKGEFDVALIRLAEHSDEDLYAHFHSKGAANLSGVSDPALDEALEGYRRARNKEAREEAKLAIAARLQEIIPVSLLYAPTQVMLVDRRVDGLSFVDDLPRLDTLRLRADSSWLTSH